MNPSAHQQPDVDPHWSIPREFGRLIGSALMDIAQKARPLDRIRASRTIMQIERSCFEQRRLEEAKRSQLAHDQRTLQAQADELLAEMHGVLRHAEDTDSVPEDEDDSGSVIQQMG